MSASENNWVEVIKEKLSGLRYGQILLTVHDGRVVQIERTEKTRLELPSLKTQPTREE
ncbi:MAG: YezD family protein [Verrucomicrobia bacterium]|nr:YezD family protein [Verrucomicrobiota bacterium]